MWLTQKYLLQTWSLSLKMKIFLGEASQLPATICERLNAILAEKEQEMPLDVTEALYRLEMATGSFRATIPPLSILNRRVDKTWRESGAGVISVEKAEALYKKYLAVYRMIISASGFETEEEQKLLNMQNLFSGVGFKGYLAYRLLSDNDV